MLMADRTLVPCFVHEHGEFPALVWAGLRRTVHCRLLRQSGCFLCANLLARLLFDSILILVSHIRLMLSLLDPGLYSGQP